MKKSNLFVKFLLLLIIICFIQSGRVYAASIDDEEQLEESLEKVAIEWSKMYNEELEVDNFIKIYNLDNQLISYSIGYKINEIEYGYIIYNLYEKRIVEFSIDENCKDIYQSIIENMNINSEFVLEKLYYLGNNEYCVEVIDNNDDYLVSNYCNVYDSSIIEKEDLTNTLNGWNDIIKEINTYSNSASYAKVRGAELSKQICLSQNYIEQTCKKYACAVVAMLELCIQNGYISVYIPGTNSYNSTKIEQAFNYLWKTSETTVYEIRNGIQYGGTKRTSIADTIVKFVKYYNNVSTTCNVKQSPSYNDFASAIDNGKSSILSVEIKLKSEKTSHAVNVFGYAIYRSYANNKYMYFLKIADGWNDKPRYIIYDVNNFVSYQAVIVN